MMNNTIRASIQKLNNNEKLLLYFLLRDHIVLSQSIDYLIVIANFIRVSTQQDELELVINYLFRSICDNQIVSLQILYKLLQSLVPCWLHAALLCSLQSEHLFNNDRFISSIISKPLIKELKELIEINQVDNQVKTIELLESKLLNLEPNHNSLTYGITQYLPPII
jgi:hypothetical protein